MKDEPEIIKELREAEQLGLIKSDCKSSLDIIDINENSEKDTIKEIGEEKEVPLKFDDEYYIKDAVFELSIAANSIADKNGIIKHVNQAFVKMWGYVNKEDAIGNNVASFFKNLDDATPVFESLNKTGIWKGEFIAKRKNGSTFISRGLATAVYTKKGEIIGYQSTNIDVTNEKKTEEELKKHKEYLEKLVNERTVKLKKTNEELQKEIIEHKQMEEDLKREEEKYHTIFDNVNDVIVFVNKHGTILEVNNKVQNVLGYKPEDIIGKNVLKLKLFKLKDTSKLIKIFKKSVKSEKIIEPNEDNNNRMEIEIRTNNKGFIFVDVDTKAIIKNGKLEGYISVLRDITERKNFEDKLKESEKNFKMLNETSPDAVITLDTKGIITSINPSGEYLLGYTKGELIGLHFSKMSSIQKRDIPKQIKTFIAAKRGKKIDPIEIDLVHKNGDKVQFEVVIGSLKKDGKIIGLQAIGRDISRRKKAEKKIAHLNSVLLSIRNVNQLITKERNPNQLIKEVCKTLVETRDYNSAWLTLIDETNKITDYAVTNVNENFLPLFNKLPKFAEKFLNSNKELDIINNSNLNFSDNYLIKIWGLDSKMLVTKLEHNGRVYGVLVVVIPSYIMIHEEEKSLIREVAGDIAFALYNISTEFDHKKIKDTLKKTEQRLDEMAEVIPVIFWISSSDGRKLHYISPAFEKIYGYPSEFIYKKENGWLDFIYPDDVDRFIDSFKKNQKNEFELDYRIIRKDKSIRWTRVHVVPILDVNRKISRLIGFGLDITEQKKIEDDMKEKIRELERYKQITTGRELKMIELKKQIKEFEEKLSLKN